MASSSGCDAIALTQFEQHLERVRSGQPTSAAPRCQIACNHCTTLGPHAEVSSSQQHVAAQTVASAGTRHKGGEASGGHMASGTNPRVGSQGSRTKNHAGGLTMGGRRKKGRGGPCAPSMHGQAPPLPNATTGKACAPQALSDEAPSALVSQASLLGTRNPMKHHMDHMFRTASGNPLVEEAPLTYGLPAPEASFLIRLNDDQSGNSSLHKGGTLSVVSEKSRWRLESTEKAPKKTQRSVGRPKFPRVPAHLMSGACTHAEKTAVHVSSASDRRSLISHAPSDTDSVISIPVSSCACGSHVASQAHGPTCRTQGDVPSHVLIQEEREESEEERNGQGCSGVDPPTCGEESRDTAKGLEEPSQRRELVAYLQSVALGADPAAVHKALEKAAVLARFNSKEAVSLGDVLADAHAVQYNDALTLLRDRMYMKGWRSLDCFFKTLDKHDSGTLPLTQFRNALLQLNVGPALDANTSDLLVRAAECQRGDTVDYGEFVEALRVGKIGYSAIDPRVHHRKLPDPARPLGDYQTLLSRSQPFGVLPDAVSNLAAFDSKINAAWEELKDIFMRIDTDHSGVVDRAEFAAALQEISKHKNLDLSAGDINNLFREADANGDSVLSWGEFMASFGSGQRFMPEFLKPKRLRCSQAGAPWAWLCPAPRKPRPRIHGFSEWLTADSVVLG